MKIKHQKNTKQQMSSKETSLSKKKDILFIAIIIILGFAIYANSLNGRFIWDDDALIKGNPVIKDWSNWKDVFTEGASTGEGAKFHFYRPLQMISYMIDYSIWGLDVRGYHLTSILWHILAALALYWFVRVLFNDQIHSLWTSILFIIHPVHTEAVSYISGRADSLALFFVLLSFTLYIKDLRRPKTLLYIGMLLSFIAALLSRENSLILPALILLYHAGFKQKLDLKKYLPVVLLAAAYMVLRVTFLKDLLSSGPARTTLLERIPGFFVAVMTYIRLIALPFNLHMEYGSNLFAWKNIYVICGAIFLFVLLIYAFRKRENNPLVFFSILWFFLSLIPVSNIFPINAYMAEHWLYLPSVGICLISAKGISMLQDSRRFRIISTIFAMWLIVFYSYLTIKQNDYWNNPLKFYKRTLKYAPGSARMHFNLGVAYNDVNEKEKAVEYYKKAIELKPKYPGAYSNLGAVYKSLHRIDDAIKAYKKAIEQKPHYAQAYFNLASAYQEANDKEQAVGAYKKAIELKPNYSEAYNNLGLLYSAMGKNKEAIDAYQMAIQIKPDFALAYSNLGVSYYAYGKKQEARDSYRRAIELNPHSAEPYNNLGIIEFDLGNYDGSIAYYKKAVEVDPNYAQAYSNLAITCFQQKNYKRAIEYCDKAKKRGFVNPALFEALKPYR